MKDLGGIIISMRASFASELMASKIQTVCPLQKPSTTHKKSLHYPLPHKHTQTLHSDSRTQHLPRQTLPKSHYRLLLLPTTMFTKEKEQELRPENESVQHANRVGNEKDTAPPATDDEKQPTEHDDHVYPSGFKLALILMSMYIGMFLVALVCEQLAGDPLGPMSMWSTCKLTRLVRRINSSSPPPYPPSPTSFTRPTISAGMERPICSPTALSCWCLANYTPYST
jgi:hypothetical protein